MGTEADLNHTKNIVLLDLHIIYITGLIVYEWKSLTGHVFVCLLPECLPIILFVCSSKWSLCNLSHTSIYQVCESMCVFVCLGICAHPSQANQPLQLSHCLKILQKQESHVLRCAKQKLLQSLYWCSLCTQREINDKCLFLLVFH